MDATHWGWPEWLFICMMGLNLVAAAVLDGRDKMPSRHNFGASLIGSAITFTILWAGGFFA